MAPTAVDPEALLSSLANLVAECRDLAQRVAALDTEAARNTAPFLHRQLGQSFKQLEAAIATAEGREGPSREGAPQASGGGLFGKLKRSLIGEKSDGQPQALREGLQGNSETVGIPELIAFLANSRKTGALWVHAPDETFLIQLRDGSLLHATSDRTPQGERLGEILVAQGSLKRGELASFLEQSKGTGLLGRRLFEEGRISEEQLIGALAAQVQHLFHRMLSTRSAIFRFEEGAELLVEYHVRLNCMQLLLETARTFDEASVRGLEQVGEDPGTGDPGDPGDIGATGAAEAATVLDGVFGGDAPAETAPRETPEPQAVSTEEAPREDTASGAGPAASEEPIEPEHGKPEPAAQSESPASETPAESASAADAERTERASAPAASEEPAASASPEPEGPLASDTPDNHVAGDRAGDVAEDASDEVVARTPRS